MEPLCDFLVGTFSILERPDDSLTKLSGGGCWHRSPPVLQDHPSFRWDQPNTGNLVDPINPPAHPCTLPRRATRRRLAPPLRPGPPPCTATRGVVLSPDPDHTGVSVLSIGLPVGSDRWSRGRVACLPVGHGHLQPRGPHRLRARRPRGTSGRAAPRRRRRRHTVRGRLRGLRRRWTGACPMDRRHACGRRCPLRSRLEHPLSVVSPHPEVGPCCELGAARRVCRRAQRPRRVRIRSVRP
ncbi:MAG: hypothetical protein ACI8PZ_005613 [Myxococcota bacterium]